MAGGCFWGLELAFQRIPGVVQTSVGYINGHMKDPSYEAVCTGRTGHAEVSDILALYDVPPSDVVFPLT